MSGSKHWTRIQVGRGKSQWQVKCSGGYSPKNPRTCVRPVTVLVLWRVWRYWGSTTTTTITTTITLATTTTSINNTSNGTVVAGVWRGSCYGGKLAVRARKRLSTYAPGYRRWASDTSETIRVVGYVEGGRESKSEKERGRAWIHERYGGKNLAGKENRGEGGGEFSGDEERRPVMSGGGRRTRVSSTTQLAPAVPDSHLRFFLPAPSLPHPSYAKAYEAEDPRGRECVGDTRGNTKLFQGERLSIRVRIEGPVSTMMGTISEARVLCIEWRKKGFQG